MGAVSQSDLQLDTKSDVASNVRAMRRVVSDVITLYLWGKWRAIFAVMQRPISVAK